MQLARLPDSIYTFYFLKGENYYMDYYGCRVYFTEDQFWLLPENIRSNLIYIPFKIMVDNKIREFLEEKLKPNSKGLKRLSFDDEQITIKNGCTTHFDPIKFKIITYASTQNNCVIMVYFFGKLNYVKEYLKNKYNYDNTNHSVSLYFILFNPDSMDNSEENTISSLAKDTDVGNKILKRFATLDEFNIYFEEMLIGISDDEDD
jgi:hypothetical protein